MIFRELFIQIWFYEYFLTFCRQTGGNISACINFTHTKQPLDLTGQQIKHPLQSSRVLHARHVAPLTDVLDPPAPVRGMCCPPVIRPTMAMAALPFFYVQTANLLITKLGSLIQDLIYTCFKLGESELTWSKCSGFTVTPPWGCLPHTLMGTPKHRQ